MSFTPRPDLATRIDTLMSTQFAADGPGAAVAVYSGGQILYARGFGLANVEWNIPIGADTVFRIGSITKQFTATAIMMLQAQGVLQLSDTLAKHVPDFPEPGREVTLLQLLQHTSGIKSYTSTPEYVRDFRNDIRLAQLIVQCVAHFKVQPRLFMVTDQQTVARKAIQRARHDARQQYLQRLRARRRASVKVLSPLRWREHAVQRQQVQMHVEVQGTAEALNQRDHAARAPARRDCPARLIREVSMARVTIASTRVSASARGANSQRNGQGNDSTHCRTGTAGNT